jgi:hypothetical protein
LSEKDNLTVFTFGEIGVGKEIKLAMKVLADIKTVDKIFSCLTFG